MIYENILGAISTIVHSSVLFLGIPLLFLATILFGFIDIKQAKLAETTR